MYTQMHVIHNFVKEIFQRDKPIVFYSRKLNPAQTR
jgi:hypothetical protein